jgi:hypothetical protein
MTSDDIWFKFLRVANWSVLITALSIFFIFDRTVPVTKSIKQAVYLGKWLEELSPCESKISCKCWLGVNLFVGVGWRSLDGVVSAGTVD